MVNKIEQKEPQGLKEFWVKPKYFHLIESGLKTLEVRIKSRSGLKVNKGEVVIFKTTIQGSPKICKRIITAIREYRGIDAILKHEDMNKVLPNQPNNTEEYKRLAESVFKGINLTQAEFDVWQLGLEQGGPE